MFESVNIFDETAMEALHELQIPGQPSFVGSLITDYLNQLESLTQTIKLSLSQTDLKALETSSHKLKSSSGALGLLRITAICQAIEKKARTNQLALEEIAELERVLPETRDVLTQYLKKIV